MMKNTEFRIMDAISRGIGNPISISGLTEEIKTQYGSAYYANIYNALISLKNENIIQIERQGKTSIPILNFTNYLLPDLLIEMELQKKREFLGRWPESQILFANLDNKFRNLSFIKSILLIDPAHNMKLNRAELLIITDNSDEANQANIRNLMQTMKMSSYTRIEYLTISEGELINLLKSPEKNPIKAMLSNKIALYMPQNFWILIRNAYAHGIRIKFDIEQTNPQKISEGDLAYNLARFGYKELGPEIRQGEDTAIECIIASIFLKEDKRRMAAIPIILAKNKANYSLLAFLSQRHGFAERLLGILSLLTTIAPSRELNEAIVSLAEAGIHPIRADESHMRETLRLYGIRPA
jgi:hypothetical protein